MTAAPPPISSSSWRMLEAIGVAERLEGEDLPDPRDPGQRRAGARRHRCSIPARSDDPLGMMVENRLLRAALRDARAAAGADRRC